MNTQLSMSRRERIVACTLALEALRQEQRIEDWITANPTAVVWTLSVGRGRRVCTVVRDGKVIAKCTGADDTDARAQAFSVIFLNEATK